MKKIITIAAIASTFAASSAFAKTAGSYAGVSVLRSSATNQYQQNGNVASNYSKFDDSSIGFGIDYKYAFAITDNVFIAPNVFFDKLGLEAKDQDGDSVSSNYRYGAKLDLGYNITDKFAAYVSAGAANVNYKVDWKSSGQKESGTKLGYIAGLGLSYEATQNIALNLEYNMQSLDFKTPDNGGINEVNSKINAFKLGVAYHF